MQYDFWNNPLVVSAMRLKYRRSSPGFLTCLYLLVLLTIGGAIHHYHQPGNTPPGLSFLMVILGLQFLLSGGIALFSVAASIHAEVANRTLDFQRIVSLPPHEILLGKMLGEPAISYLLAIASVPFAVICWIEGSTSLTAIGMFYLNLLTFTLLCAAIGTLHTLVPAASGASARKSGSIGTALFWLPMLILPSMMSSSAGWMRGSGMGTIINLCTPLGSLRMLFDGTPWEARVSLWGFNFPSLVVAPFTQLVFTYWIIMAMSRRLKNPVDPPIRRSHTYLALLVFDLLVAGTCYSQWLEGSQPTFLIAQFCALHLVVSLLLLLGITPTKPVLLSWLWRFREREPGLRGFCLGSRSEISWVLPIYALIGAGILVSAFALPTASSASSLGLPVAGSGVYLHCLAVTSALILAFGMLHQLCVAVAGSKGLMVYLVCLLLVNLMPTIVAAIMVYPDSLNSASGPSAIVASLSPGTYYLSFLARATRQPLPIVFLIATALGLALGCSRYLKKWLLTQQAVIARKLGQMKLNR